MAKKFEVTCKQCGGTGWFVEDKYGCFQCKGYKKTKGTGIDKDSVAFGLVDEVFNHWIDRQDAVKECAKATGWEVKMVRSYLNHTMYGRLHLLAFHGGKVIAKAHYTQPEISDGSNTEEIPAPAEQ